VVLILSNRKIICQNKKAHHEYFIEDIYQCGIVLHGTEIKSIRQGKVNINDSYCQVIKGHMIIMNMHISKYEKGNLFNHDPDRDKVLLLHKKEIYKLQSYVQRDGYTLIPLSVYLEQGLCKIDLGVCKGKKLFDKRETLKEKSIKMEEKKSFKY
jgi:SsrA-binding protein